MQQLRHLILEIFLHFYQLHMFLQQTYLFQWLHLEYQLLFVYRLLWLKYPEEHIPVSRARLLVLLKEVIQHDE